MSSSAPSPLAVVLPPPLGSRGKKIGPPPRVVLPPSLGILPRRPDRASPWRDQSLCHQIDLIPNHIKAQALGIRRRMAPSSGRSRASSHGQNGRVAPCHAEGGLLTIERHQSCRHSLTRLRCPMGTAKPKLRADV